jgi:hypothetical protein
MIRGEVMADKLTLSPWAAMWGPNLLLGAIGIFLVIRMSRENYLGEPILFKTLMGVFRKKPVEIQVADILTKNDRQEVNP